MFITQNRSFKVCCFTGHNTLYKLIKLNTRTAITIPYCVIFKRYTLNIHVFLFQENVRLKLCNISWNGFGPEGGAAVGEAMVSNNALLELDVSGNRLTVDTAMKMARMISGNDNIRTLRVNSSSQHYLEYTLIKYRSNILKLFYNKRVCETSALHYIFPCNQSLHNIEQNGKWQINWNCCISIEVPRW